MSRISSRIAAIAPSATLAVDSKAKALKAAGRPVDGLGTLSETRVPPRWEELDAVRSISALVDERHALLEPHGHVVPGAVERVA